MFEQDKLAGRGRLSRFNEVKRAAVWVTGRRRGYTHANDIRVAHQICLPVRGDAKNSDDSGWKNGGVEPPADDCGRFQSDMLHRGACHACDRPPAFVTLSWKLVGSTTLSSEHLTNKHTSALYGCVDGLTMFKQQAKSGRELGQENGSARKKRAARQPRARVGGACLRC